MRFPSVDLRLAARRLWRSPAFTLAVVLTLALGVGANVAMLTAVRVLLLEPLPFPEPDRLVALHTAGPDRRPSPSSLLDVLDWQEEIRSVDRLAAYRRRSFLLQGPTSAEPSVTQVGMVTAGFLEIVGARPARGRLLSPEDDAHEALVIVLSDRLWRRELGADPRIVGRQVSLNEEPRLVVGVLQPGVDLPIQGEVPDAFVPLSRRVYGASRSIRSLDVIGRLAPGASLTSARVELRSIAARLAAAFPETNEAIEADLRPLDDRLRGGHRLPLLLLSAATGLLLILAWVNVSGLLLERLLARAGELALRASLGASPSQVARSLWTESLLVTAVGTSAALTVAWVLLRSLLWVLPLLGKTPLSPWDAARLHLDRPALLGAAAIFLLTALLLGGLAAWVVRRAGIVRLVHGAGRIVVGPGRWRGSLVSAQVSLSLILLLSTGLLVRSFLQVSFLDPGFDTEGVVRFGIGLPESRYDTGPKLAGFHHELQGRLERLPGVRSVGAFAPLPLAGRVFQTSVARHGSSPAEQPAQVALSIISPGALETMGIPLLRGRQLEPGDDAGAPRVLLVNRAFQAAFERERSPLGERLQIGWHGDLDPPGTTWEIVGIVGDTRPTRLEQAPVPMIYLPISQFPVEGCSYVLKASPSPRLEDAIRSEIRALDPALERIHLGTMEDLRRRDLGTRSLGLLLLGAFAGTALLVTAVGVYAAVAIHAGRRRREMVVRMALGARARQAAGLILRQGMRLAVSGLALGLAGFVPLSGLIRSQLYDVSPADPVAIVGACVLMAFVVLAASAVPARRVARPHDFRSLRED